LLGRLHPWPGRIPKVAPILGLGALPKVPHPQPRFVRPHHLDGASPRWSCPWLALPAGRIPKWLGRNPSSVASAAPEVLDPGYGAIRGWHGRRLEPSYGATRGRLGLPWIAQTPTASASPPDCSDPNWLALPLITGRPCSDLIWALCGAVALQVCL